MRTERLTFVNAAIVAGATGQIQRAQLGMLQSQTERSFLRQVLVGFLEGLAGITSQTSPGTDVQPILAKVYLAQPLLPGDALAAGTSMSVPVDEGYLRSGSGATSQGLVGMVGALELHPAAALVVDLANDSAATLNAGNVLVHVLIDIYGPDEVLPVGGLTRLSTEHWARWQFRNLSANGAGGASDITWTVSFFKGSLFIPDFARITNADASARTCSVVVRDEDANTIFDLIPSASIAAAASRSYPVGNSTAADNNVQNHPALVYGTRFGGFTEGTDILATAAAVALSQDAAFAIGGWVRGRKPSVGIVVGGGGAASASTQDRLL